MGVVKLSTAGILDYSKTSNFLSGNAPLSLGSFYLLETTTLATSASSITFSGLDSYAADYKHLQIRMVVRSTNSSSYGAIAVRFNGDSGNNYSRHNLYGDGSSVTSTANTSVDRILSFAIASDNDTSGKFDALVGDIYDFSSSSKNSTIRAAHQGTQTATETVRLVSGAWYDTNAITSINILENSANNFVAGTRVSLIGIK